MGYRLAADAVVLLHVAFIAFVVLGGLLAFRHRWVAAVHVPAAVWAVLIESFGWICPLTPLEVQLRIAGGEAGYTGASSTTTSCRWCIRLRLPRASSSRSPRSSCSSTRRSTPYCSGGRPAAVGSGGVCAAGRSGYLHAGGCTTEGFPMAFLKWSLVIGVLIAVLLVLRV